MYVAPERFPKIRNGVFNMVKASFAHLFTFFFSVLLSALPTTAYSESNYCAAKQLAKAGSYFECLAHRAAFSLVAGIDPDMYECENISNFISGTVIAETLYGDGTACGNEPQTELTNYLQDAYKESGNYILGATSLPNTLPSPGCVPSETNLLDFEAWQREAGYWVGEYTFLGADGDPYKSASWPYLYDHYKGFIYLKVDGDSIAQRNVFLYPPQAEDACDAEINVIGDGACGINGNEKLFSADQSASDCKGGLAGPYTTFGISVDTRTKLIGEDTVVYQVAIPAGNPYGLPPMLLQNQLTTLPGNNSRVRTAQGFAPFSGPSYASFYREKKVSKEEFFEMLKTAREEYDILPSDECAWDNNGAASNTSCEEHFDI